MQTESVRKVIYTSLVGNYDTLPQPLVVRPDYDYVCVIDKVDKATDGVWRFIKNPYHNPDSKRCSEWPRMHPHLLFADYDYSLYFDANIQILDDQFYEYVERAIEKNVQIAQVPHPVRDCIYLELEHCLNIRKVTPWQYIRHRQRYAKYGVPKHWGLYENGMLLRKHNDDKVVSISEDWWREYCRISNRDQLSLMLVYWQQQYKPSLLFDDGLNIRTSKSIRCISHNTQSKVPTLKSRILHFFERKFILPLYRRWVHAEDYQSRW